MAENSSNVAVFTSASARRWIFTAGALTLVIGIALGVMITRGRLDPLKAIIVLLGVPGVVLILLGAAALVVETVLPIQQPPTAVIQAAAVLANAETRLAEFNTRAGAHLANNEVLRQRKQTAEDAVAQLKGALTSGSIDPLILGNQQVTIASALREYAQEVDSANSVQPLAGGVAPPDSATATNNRGIAAADGAIAAGTSFATQLAEATKGLTSGRTLLTWGAGMVSTAVFLLLVASGTVTINPSAPTPAATTSSPEPATAPPTPGSTPTPP